MIFDKVVRGGLGEKVTSMRSWSQALKALRQ